MPKPMILIAVPTIHKSIEIVNIESMTFTESNGDFITIHFNSGKSISTTMTKHQFVNECFSGKNQQKELPISIQKDKLLKKLNINDENEY